MGIRNQRVEIGFSIKTITRCVYDIRDNDQLKFQTGFVQYDNNEIPVWRPIDPTNKSHDAPWRSGKWENIYTLRMKHLKDKKYVAYEAAEIEIDGKSIGLPVVSSELMYAFKEYVTKISPR